jgi:ribosomal protein RSM22 (predicted rRNA methylase)
VLPDSTLRELSSVLDVVRAPLLEGTPSNPYLEEARSAAAYAVGLAPRTVSAVAAELPQLPPNARILDVGAGLGAASLACLCAGATHFTLVDHGARALGRAREMLLRAGAASVETRTLKLDGGAPALGRKFDGVVMAFALLESCADDPVRAAAMCAWLVGHVGENGFLLLLDSAQKGRARVLNGLRETLLSLGLHLWAPCPHALACPALVRERDFCHAARDWNLPEDLARLGEMSGLHRSRLTYAFLLAGRTPRAASGVNALVVGDVQKEKGRARLMVCTGSPVRELVVLQRHKEAFRAALDVERGTALCVPLEQAEGPALRVEDVSWLQAR